MQQMTKILLAILTVLCVNQVFADTEKPKELSGFYIGIAGGNSKYNDDDAFDDVGFELDDSDSSLQFFAGYRILKYLAVEAAYTDLGTYQFDLGVFSGEGEREFSAFSVAAVGILPVSDSGVEFYAKAGIGVLSMDTSVDNSSVIVDADDTGISILLGLGVSYTPNNFQHFSLRAGVESHLFVLEQSTSFFDEEEYAQTVDSFYIGATLNF